MTTDPPPDSISSDALRGYFRELPDPMMAMPNLMRWLPLGKHESRPEDGVRSAFAERQWEPALVLG